MDTYVATAIVLTLWSSALIGTLIGPRRRAGAVALQRLAAALASALAVVVAISASDRGGDGLLVVDRLGGGIVVFVTMMSAVVGSFAARALAPDPRADRFFAAANALTGSTVLLATADRAWLMAVAWIAISMSTVAMIAFDGRPRAIAAARRAARIFVIGDVGVVVACVVAAIAASGSANLASTAVAVTTSNTWVALLVGSALLVGALARSAQLPFSGWLPASVAAPTPVSAMLHAGVVNGSAVLLIRWNPVLADSTAITVAAVLVSIAGITVGMAVGRTRPDVKTGLAWTTVAQMGFMILQCSVGLVGPAVVHLMAHGLFKSSLFLGAGSGLDGGGHHRHPEAIRPTHTQLVGAGATAAGIVALGLAIVRPEFLHHPAAFLPVSFATLTVAYGLVQWWARTATESAYLRLAPIPAVVIGVTLLTAVSSQVDRWIGSAGATTPNGATWLAASAVAVVAALALGAGTVARRRPALAGRVWMHMAAATAPTAESVRPGHVAAGPGAFTTGRSSADPARRARIRSTIVAAADDIAPSWPLERFVATNPLLSSEHLPLERAIERAASDLGVRAEFDETTYRARFAEGRISIDELRRAAADHLAEQGGDDGLPGVPSEAAVDGLVAELLGAKPEQLPTTRPVLISEWHDLAAGTRWADTVDELSSWWCAAYLSDHPASPLPRRDAGLYASWRSLVANDPRPGRAIGASFADLLAALPERSDDAVMQLLVEVGVDRPDHVEYLRHHLHRHRGWTSALIRASGIDGDGDGDGDDLIDYLAIRLTYEAALLSDSTDRRLARRTGAAHRQDEVAHGQGRRLGIWREAYEIRYRDGLLSSLTPVTQDDSATVRGDRPATQVVCCIDPRSEGLRRHLESVGPHETIGFAGFFGLPVAVVDLDASAPVGSCPVIVTPQATVIETVIETATAPADRADRLAAMHSAFDVFATAKRSTASPFALAETLGWASGAVTVARTLAPNQTASAARALRRAIVPEVESSMVPAPDDWWTLDVQVSIAASILRTTGLHRNAARLVMLCGHTSRHVNNLHRASLDCGACGGRAGGNNARIAANLLNDPEVRSGLEAAGIVVHQDTRFVAAEHDTTSDRVEILDRHLVPASHRAQLASLESDLATAGERIAAERGITLPATVGGTVGTRPAAVQRRGNDWAQTVPEWGLVENAAMVIGPRSLSSSTDLRRRVFLHSYDAADDVDGTVLAAIMAGPVQVAHWISSQYRLSTIDPDRLGAGTKTAHNLVGGVGVLEGADGDIRLGLPIESVSCSGRDVHEPMRLLVVVDADPDLVDHALEIEPDVARLVDNGWIRLAARADHHDASPTSWTLRRRGGGWVTWHGSRSAESPESPTAAPDTTHPVPISA